MDGNLGLDLSLRKLSINILLCIGVYFESWVKFLGFPLSTSKTLSEF
jgi:hypothetical protein